MAIRYAIPTSDKNRYVNSTMGLDLAHARVSTIENTIVNDFRDKYGLHNGARVRVYKKALKLAVVKGVECWEEKGTPVIRIQCEIESNFGNGTVRVVPYAPHEIEQVIEARFRSENYSPTHQEENTQ